MLSQGNIKYIISYHMYDIKRMKDFVENMYQQEHAWLLGEKKSDGIAWEKNGWHYK